MDDTNLEGATQINSWNIDADELERLRSGDSVISNDAWASLWQRMLPLVEKKIEFQLRDSPQRVRERIDDIAQEVALVAAKLVHIEADKSFGHIMYGVVEKTCMKALRPTFHSKVMGDNVRKYSHFKQKEQTVKAWHLDLSEELRKAVTRGLQNVLAQLASQSSMPRLSDARAPILGMLAIDLSCTGHPAPADLLKVSGIANHTATRLRNYVSELMFDAMESELAASEFESELKTASFDIFHPDLDPAFVWVSHHNMGCPPWWFQEVHPSHRDDVAIYLKAHCDQGKCPYCDVIGSCGFDQKRLDHWLNATKDSMLKVSSGRYS